MNLDEILDKCTEKNLINITISGVKNKNALKINIGNDVDYNICQCGCNEIVNAMATKIKIRPVKIKKEGLFQSTETVGTKVIHKNMSYDQLREYISYALTKQFKQGQFEFIDGNANILSGKSGNMTIKYKKSNDKKEQKNLTHNRNKKYILPEGTVVDFLVDLGVMTPEGKIVNSKYDKYRQINRFLEFIEDILPNLNKDKEQTIIDFGCGKSYLTFAMYYYLKVLKGYNIRIIGLDLKDDVIKKCNLLRTKYGYEKLDFFIGDIASYKDVDSVDMVVTLHACDTATDYALYKAVKWGAKVILSVPCCQHEANKQIKSDLLEPVLKYGILKERMSAIFTDAIRANWLEEYGYRTQILEFIDMEHTPKNLLIRAIYSGEKNEDKKYKDMQHMLKLDLTLNKLSKNEEI